MLNPANSGGLNFQKYTPLNLRQDLITTIVNFSIPKSSNWLIMIS